MKLQKVACRNICGEKALIKVGKHKWSLTFICCAHASLCEQLTFSVELDSMDNMLMQMELTVIAGDQESYNISARSQTKKH